MKTRLLIFTLVLFTQIGFSQWVKLGNTIDGEAAFDYLGDSKQLAISGDGNIVAVSSPDNSNCRGSVKVYRNINSIWTLINNEIEGNSNSLLGTSIELSKNGEIIAIGEPGNNNIRILENTNNSWSQKGNEIKTLFNANIGNNIAMNADGTFLATTISDKIIIFKFSNNVWSLNREIILPGNRNFLNTASLEFSDNGNFLIVGNRLYNGNNDGTEDGRVLIYENVNDVWSQKGSAIISNNNESYFGDSVDISGDGSLIVVGSPHTEVNGNTQAGFARTYKFENNDWIQVGSDINGLVEDINLGRSVSLNIDGSILAVGADGRGSSGNGRGIAQIFRFENNDWVKIHSTIIGEASRDAFGASIALNDSGSIVAIGAPDNDNNSSNSGNVRVFIDDNAPKFTAIPDQNFEQYLIDEGIDTELVLDGKIKTEDAIGRLELNLNGKNVSNLTGIEAFVDLEVLYAGGISNSDGFTLSSVNLFSNTKLKQLFIAGNELSTIDLSNNTELTQIVISRNNLSTLDLTNNTKLLRLDAGENNLTTIDLSQNTLLERLRLTDNQLTNISLINNRKLDFINVDKNQLSELRVQLLLDLTVLEFAENNLSTIDLSRNTKLVAIDFSQNNFREIDVSNNDKLTGFIANDNQLTEIDLVINDRLTYFNASRNNLVNVNLSNGNNQQLINFDCLENPQLLCIQVSDATFMERFRNNIDAQTDFNIDCPKLTAIPDANFEAYLESINAGNGITGDGFVSTELIEILETLDIRSKNIADLTGIENFTALKTLNATNNNITAIDISNNLALETLFISQNNLTAIDLSTNVNLKDVNVGENQLTSLSITENINLESVNFRNNAVTNIDFSKNTKLKNVYSNRNNLQSLDVSMLPDLETLWCANNQLSALNIANNIKLTSLDCGDNAITILNVDANTALEQLFVSRNQLTALNVDKNTALTILVCEQNSIEFLDLSANEFLTRIICNDNALLSLNLKNGNNSNIQNSDFSAFANPSLTCIQVDDVNYSDNTWSAIDMQMSFSTNCPDLVAIPDANFEAHLESLNLGNGIVGDTFVDRKLLNNVTSLSIDSKNISDLTGIEFFTSLTFLDVVDNNLSQIDLSNNILLETFIADFNQFTTINLSANVKLKTFEARNNQLSSLDISMLVDLQTLELEDNFLTELDVTLNTKLAILDLKDNQLENLDFSNNPALLIFEANNNSLRFINLKNTANPTISTFNTLNNPKLTCIEVLDVDYFAQFSSNIDAQTAFYFNCPSTTAIPDANFEAYLESINVGNGAVNDGLVLTEKIEVLETLDIRNKNIADIKGLEDFTVLKELLADNNAITQIDLSQNLNLEKLFITNNQITNLNLGNNLKLKNLDAGTNNIFFINVSDLKDLESLSLYNNQLTSINLISNQKLQAFIANDNLLEYVDVRNNPALFWLDLDDNLLEDLMLKNGNNTNISQFSITGNPNLGCVEVDDVDFSNTNWTEKDATANYSLDCAPFNDSCTKAIPLIYNQPTTGDVNSGTANNTPFCAVGNVIADVWYTVVVPDSGEFSIEGTTPIGDLKFAVYTNCQSTVPITCGSNISLKNLTVGETFYLKIWVESASAKTNQNLESGLFTITVSESSVLSIENTVVEKSISLYPNPATSFVSFKTANNTNIEFVEIYNTIGKKVFYKKINSNQEFTINTKNFASGIYFIKAKVDEILLLKKLIIK